MTEPEDKMRRDLFYSSGFLDSSAKSTPKAFWRSFNKVSFLLSKKSVQFSVDKKKTKRIISFRFGTADKF